MILPALVIASSILSGETGAGRPSPQSRSIRMSATFSPERSAKVWRTIRDEVSLSMASQLPLFFSRLMMISNVPSPFTERSLPSRYPVSPVPAPMP